ncbi:unnamed protein product, partial [Symbiodinium necroappetens]
NLELAARVPCAIGGVVAARASSLSFSRCARQRWWGQRLREVCVRRARCTALTQKLGFPSHRALKLQLLTVLRAWSATPEFLRSPLETLKLLRLDSFSLRYNSNHCCAQVLIPSQHRFVDQGRLT